MDFTMWFCTRCKRIGKLPKSKEFYWDAFALALAEHRDKFPNCPVSKDRINILTDREYVFHKERFGEFQIIADASTPAA